MNTDYTMALIYPSANDNGSEPVPSLENMPIEKLKELLEAAEKNKHSADIDYDDYIKVLTEEIQRREK